MTILTIGEPVKLKKRPTNKWRLHVHVMHGDADHDETNKEDFAFTHAETIDPELAFKIETFKNLFAMHWNDQCDENALGIAIEKAEETTGYKAHCDAFIDLVPKDVTCQNGRKAMPREMWITFFDANGTEFEVILPDGKKEWANS